MLSESLHPNRLVAGSFASPSRDLLQIGFRLYPLPNNAITGKAGDIGFIQRNGWFGRSYRQTVKLSDFVSHPQVEVKRTVNGAEETLRYGVDYLLSYENNTAFGTGKVIVTGIVNYRGVVERTFEIVKKAPELSAVYIQSQPGKTVYKSGETFDPTGLSLKLVYDDDSEEELVYSEETAGLFGFEPGLDTALTEEVKEITVAYGGKSAVVFIGVESSEKPGPEKPDPENPTPGNPNPEKPNPEDPKPGNGSGSENNGGTGSGSESNSNNGSSGGNNTVNNIINNNNNNNSNSSNKNSGKVQTGDRNNLVFPLIGMTAAILAIATVLIIRKKKRL